MYNDFFLIIDTHLLNKLTNYLYSVCGAGLPTSADQSIRPSIGIYIYPISIYGIISHFICYSATSNIQLVPPKDHGKCPKNHQF